MEKSNLKQIFADDPEMLRMLEEREQTSLLKELVQRKAIIGNIELIKGEKGDEPSDDRLISLINPLIPEPISGFDGLDGKDGKDGRSIIGPPGPKGEKGDSIVGPKGDPGKDGKSIAFEEAVSFIENLKGEEAKAFGKRIGSMIDISQIRNAQSFIYNGRRIKFEELMHGGGSSSGTSTGFQVPTGTVDGINTVFTFVTAPNAIVVDGISMRKVAADGTVNWTGTTVITLTVAPNFDIYSVA